MRTNEVTRVKVRVIGTKSRKTVSNHYLQTGMISDNKFWSLGSMHGDKTGSNIGLLWSRLMSLLVKIEKKKLFLHLSGMTSCNEAWCAGT